MEKITYDDFYEEIRNLAKKYRRAMLIESKYSWNGIHD